MINWVQKKSGRGIAPVKINDVTLRDGHQSLLATRMRIDDIVGIASLADDVGFNALEVWGGATFDVAIRFKGEAPWNNLRRIKKAAPRTPLMMLLRGQSLVGYKNYADDVVDAFVEKAAENGISIFRVFDALNYTPNLERAIKKIKELQTVHPHLEAQGAICYTISPVHTIETYLKTAQELKDMGCDTLCIKDMAGLLDPATATDLVKVIKENTGLPLTVHTHATMGLSDSTLLAAVKAGVDCIDTASRALSGGYGHSSIETMLDLMLWDQECAFRRPRIDQDQLGLMRQAVYIARPKYAKFQARHDRSNIERIYKSQVPGGMLSNFESQIKAQLAPRGIDYSTAMDMILDEIPKTREDLGWAPLVTPASQIVGVQAVLNVLSQTEGKPRYNSLSDGTKGLLLGKLGQTPAKPDQSLVDRLLKDNKNELVTTRPADHIPDGLLTAVKNMEDKSLPTNDMEDILIAALWDDLGFEFLKNRTNVKNISSYEPMPRIPDFLGLTIQFNIKDIAMIGPGDVSQVVGLDLIENLAHMLLEETRLTDGTWKNLPPEFLNKRVSDVRARIQTDLSKAKQKLKDSPFDDQQKYGAIDLMNRLLKQRCDDLGVTIPTPELSWHLGPTILPDRETA